MEDKFSWLLTLPGSRDPRGSLLYHHCTCLALLRQLVEDGRDIEQVIVGTKALAAIVADWLRTRCPQVIVTYLPEDSGHNGPHGLRERIQDVLLPLRHLWTQKSALDRFATKRDLHQGPATLIDTFTAPGFIGKDRYWGTILEALSEEEQANIFFVPTPAGVSLSDLNDLCSQMAASPRPFVFKEHYISRADILAAWIKALRSTRLKVPEISFRSFPIRSLVVEDLRGVNFLRATMNGFLNYQFVKRLKSAGIQVRAALDWFENQPMDRGWNAGFNHYFPETKTIAYLGYPPLANNISAYPTSWEFNTGVIAKTLAVIGPLHREQLTELCPEARVVLAPALRYTGIDSLDSKKVPPDEFTVLIALPQTWEASRHIVFAMGEALSLLAHPPRILLKMHPTEDLRTHRKELEKSLPQAQFTSEPLPQLLESISMVVTASSTIMFEILVNGIPLALVENPCCMTLIPLPVGLPSHFARTCYTAKDLAEQMQTIMDVLPTSSQSFRKLGMELKENYFVPVTRQGVLKLLALDEPGHP